MQVPLNDESEYDGGRLVWALPDGLTIPPRAAGSATIHTTGIVHGVTAHTRGVRCSLFLCTLPEPPSLEYLIAPALEQLRFFERALRYIDTASDEALSGCVREYESFLLSGEGDVAPLLLV